MHICDSEWFHCLSHISSASKFDECSHNVEYRTSKSAFVFYLWWTFHSKSALKWEINWQRLLDIYLQLKTHHRCDGQNWRDFYVIEMKVIWFFLHVGLVNIGLVILVAMPVKELVLLFYWRCFCFCVLAFMQNLDALKCKGIVIALLYLCFEIAIFLCCLSSTIPWMILDALNKRRNFSLILEMDCQKFHHCVSRTALMLGAYTSLWRVW